jgi:hypothetical protein
MNDAPRNMPNGQSHAQPADLSSDQAIENAALAGAAAVQRLVAERNGLRARLTTQQRELTDLRSMNSDLRRRLVTIHQHYVEMAKRVVGDLEQVDGTIREVAQEAHDGAAQWEDAAGPDSLVRRLEEVDQSEPARPNGSVQPKA